MSFRNVIETVKKTSKLSNFDGLKHPEYDDLYDVLGLFMKGKANDSRFRKDVTLNSVWQGRRPKVINRLRKRYGGSSDFWQYLYAISLGRWRKYLPTDGTKYRTLRFLKTKKARKMFAGEIGTDGKKK